MRRTKPARRKPPDETYEQRLARSAKARETSARVRGERAAVLAVDDPVRLERARRIIIAALQRNRLTLADLDPTFADAESGSP